MRKLTIASLFLVLGSSSLAFACNGTEDDTADDAAGTGGLGGGDGATGGSGPGTGGGGPADTSACADGNRGTSVGAGTCALINDFEGAAFTASVDLGSDGRTGAGIDFLTPGEPRISKGQCTDSSTSAKCEETVTGEGTLEQVDGGANGSAKAVHFTFTGGKSWGGAFSQLVTNDKCYDASAYEGIQFYAKAAASSTKSIYVGVGTAATNPLYDCPADAECYNSGRKVFTLTDEWVLYTATWAELKKPGWGVAWGTDTSETNDQMVSISFSDNGALPEGNAIEFYVDDIAFTGGDSTACGEPGMGGGTGL